MSITANKLRQMYLDFFEKRGHKIISSSSLIPENDPTVLFTTAGMHPLVPYLLGNPHPAGKRLADVQKCVRTADIEEVGDASHLTFFEMLGNWSLGDYFKKESIAWSYEFLTSADYLNLPKEKLSVSVFEGNCDCPRDEESASHWLNAGVPKERIFYLPKENNWWGPAGQTGPCGPDTEIFYDTGLPPCSEACSPACGCGKWLEIWNNVFMQYNKKSDGTFESLTSPNVDTGMGLERTVCVLNGLKSVYDIDIFKPIINRISELSQKSYGKDADTDRAFRIVADHVRTAVFIIGDRQGVTPSNVDQGYILRRIIRRAIRYMNKLNIERGGIVEIAALIADNYSGTYAELKENREKILSELTLEEGRFMKTLVSGEKEFNKVIEKLDGGIIDGVIAFKLYDTYGFPVELTAEFAAERGIKVDMEGFKAKFQEHQAKSQEGSSARFKGGLIDNSDATTKLHTATHLLQAALRKVLGDEVKQKGSNITAERLRFDFSFGRPMTEAEIAETERIVNEAINADIPCEYAEMTVEEAKGVGAIGLFGDRYGEIVKVYTFGGVSCEICGGPHVERTGVLGRFTISKEQSSSSGVRRIKAELEEQGL